MPEWIKEVPVSETREDRLYFVARVICGEHNFWSRYLNGKETWSIKPGIGIRFYGGSSLVRTFAKNPKVALVAVEVPPDADQRWRKRKRKFRQNK